jgi:hypothetical protein
MLPKVLLDGLRSFADSMANPTYHHHAKESQNLSLVIGQIQTEVPANSFHKSRIQNVRNRLFPVHP